MIETFIFILFIAICFLLFLLLRNNWVYKVRMEILNDDMSKYKQLPEYSSMLYRFWIWDIERFIDDNSTAKRQS